MTRAGAPRRIKSVARFWWRRPAGLLLVFMLANLWAGSNASAQAIPTTDSPVVFVQLESGAVTVEAGPGKSTLIEADPGVMYRHIRASPQVDARIPAQVRLWAQTIRTPAGTLSLPPEPFVFPPFSPVPHDALIVRGTGNVTLHVPLATALVVANVRRGAVQIYGYHGVFVTHVGVGNVALSGVGGVGAVQVGAGRVNAYDSNFARLRVRTTRADIDFINCSAQQIQATSLTGSILYDDGAFEAGLARFETTRGNVMVGVASGGVQIGAHSNAGKIYSGFGAAAQIDRSSPTDAQALVNGGGPVVTATSASGAVMFYAGALRDHPRLLRRLPPRLRAAAGLRAEICARPQCRP
jgi:hypothetical protein